jgi:hypothetical protein
MISSYESTNRKPPTRMTRSSSPLFIPRQLCLIHKYYPPFIGTIFTRWLHIIDPRSHHHSNSTKLLSASSLGYLPADPDVRPFSPGDRKEISFWDPTRLHADLGNCFAFSFKEGHQALLVAIASQISTSTSILRHRFIWRKKQRKSKADQMILSLGRL